MYNSKPVTQLLGEMIAVVAVASLAVLYTSRKAMVLSKAEELINDPFGVVMNYDDGVVIGYARGRNTIKNVFAEGMLLISIFTPWASLDHNNPLAVSGGDSGGGCGSSCGGGCGGGGCGGCGS